MGDLLSGLDLCFDPNNLGTNDGEGHYPLGYGLIQIVNNQWVKVNGYSENVVKGTDFFINIYDRSGTVSTIDFVNISWRPSADNTSKASADSPFNSADFDDMQQGKSLQSSGLGTSTGCGPGGSSTASGNRFLFGQYTFKNEGPFEVTIEMRISVNGLSLQFKCDPKIIVGSGG